MVLTLVAFPMEKNVNLDVRVICCRYFFGENWLMSMHTQPSPMAFQITSAICHSASTWKEMWLFRDRYASRSILMCSCGLPIHGCSHSAPTRPIMEIGLRLLQILLLCW